MPLPNIGAPELIVILIIALLLLGPGKLPDVAQSLGKSVREFRKAVSDTSEAAKLEPTAQSQPTATPPVAASPAPATPPEAPVVPAPASAGEPVAAGSNASDRDSTAA